MNKLLIFTAIITIQLTTNCKKDEKLDVQGKESRPYKIDLDTNIEIRNKIKAIVKTISDTNMLMGDAVGFAGIMPEQYNSFLELKNKATENELLKLTKHKNGVVRAYSFWALAYHSNANLYAVLKNHISDTDTISTMFGCIISSMKVGDFFIDVVTPNMIDTSARTLDSNQFYLLDSILLFTDNNLDKTLRVLRKIKPKENYYNRIRFLVEERKVTEAYIALSKFKKEEDVNLFLSIGKNLEERDDGIWELFQAIQNFPHLSFFPILENYISLILDNTHYGTDWREMYLAIAAYKNDNSARLLETPFTEVKHQSMREYHIGFLFNAINKHKSKKYLPLYRRLWTDENKISIELIDYLNQESPNWVYNQIKSEVQNLNRVYNSNSDIGSRDIDKPEKLISKMMEIIFEKDSTYGSKILIKNIPSSNVHVFPIICEYVCEIRDNYFVKPLLKRLEIEDNAHVYLKIIEALFSYKDEAINSDILKIRQKNKNLKQGWGGRKFDDLLEKNKII